MTFEQRPDGNEGWRGHADIQKTVWAKRAARANVLRHRGTWRPQGMARRLEKSERDGEWSEM